MFIHKDKIKLLIISFILTLPIIIQSAQFDTTIECNVCHVNPKYIMHTNNFEGSGLSTTLPLYDNKIACRTCHKNHSENPDKKISSYLNFLLRIPNAPNSSLCINCHDDKKYIIGTDHDMQVTAKEAINSLGQTTLKMGTCSACHLIHNGSKNVLWGREDVGIEDATSTMCRSCHNEKGIASEKTLNQFGHPIANADLNTKNITTTLPLFNSEGKKSFEGKISCATCHDAHQWSPEEKKQGLFINEKSNASTSFLRFNNQKKSQLCINCHKIEAFIIGTAHDLSESEYYEKNINEKTALDDGPCSSCHITHNAKNNDNFSREYGEGEDIITQKCSSCHAKNKIANKKTTGELSHPINIRIKYNKDKINLPLYNQNGNEDVSGTITCITCHNIHQWTPDKSELFKINDEKSIDINLIKKNIIGKVIIIKENSVYVDYFPSDIKISKGKILSVSRDNKILGRLKVINFNPFAKQSEIYSTIISDELKLTIKKDDIIFDQNVGSILTDGNEKGSFLRYMNNKSDLCIECHVIQKTILNNKHNLTINFPEYLTNGLQKVSTSGPCSACHLTHKAKGKYLIDISPVSTNQKIDFISNVCINCHNSSGIASKKDIKNHHKTIEFPRNNNNLVPPPSFMPLYDIDQNNEFGNIIGCGTCHNVHQWDPDNPDDNTIAEGSSLNSFLRVKNENNFLCEHCHKKNAKHLYEDKYLYKLEEKLLAQSIEKAKSESLKGKYKITITSPINNAILTSNSGQISGFINDSTTHSALLLINGNSKIIPLFSDGSFLEKISFKEGINKIRILVSINGEYGDSGETICNVDTIKPEIIAYDFQKNIGIMNNFIIKLIFNQQMNKDIMPKINFINENGDFFPAKLSNTFSGKFYIENRDKKTFERLYPSFLDDKDIVTNETDYFGYDNKPIITLKDYSKNINPGPGNDIIYIFANSDSEPKNERIFLKESRDYEGIFTGEVELGRWNEPNDKMIGINDDENFNLNYNLVNYSTTYVPDDTLITASITISPEMSGKLKISIENALSANGNPITKDESQSIIVDQSLFYITNEHPIKIQEGEITRTNNIHIAFNVPDAVYIFISENKDFTKAIPESYSNFKEYFISNNPGDKILYFKFTNKFEATSKTFSLNIKYIPIEFKSILDKNINENTVLKAEQSPYLIRKSITVESNATLTIEEGTRFWIDSSSEEKIKINVLGKLLANGSDKNRIIFSSNSVNPNPGDWSGIHFTNSSENKLKYIDILYSSSAISLINSSASFENIKCQFNKVSGISCDKSNAKISLSDFSNNNKAIVVKNFASPEILNNNIIKNNIGILCEGMSSPKIFGNTIIKNDYAGIDCLEMSSPSISNNYISQNSIYGMHIIKSSPMIYQNTIIENKIGIYCENFHTPFLVKNNNIYNNREYSFKLNNFKYSLDISRNWWGVRNSEIIKIFTYDYFDNNSLGRLNVIPILESIIIPKNMNFEIDKNVPILLTTEYKNPANATTHYQILFLFDKSLNPFVQPKVTLTTSSGDNINIPNGMYLSMNMENDAYIVSEITLSESISGKINIYIENVQDLSGNIIQKIKSGEFSIDDSIYIKEGDYISSPDITILSKKFTEDKILISEDKDFKESEWQDFNGSMKFSLSSTEGKKILYSKVFSNEGKISILNPIEINFDKSPPRIINFESDVPTINNNFQIGIIFNESLNAGIKPLIKLKSDNKSEFILPEGKNSSILKLNDTYISTPVILPKNLEGNITVSIENVFDITGNKMNQTSMKNILRYDIVPPSSMVTVKEGSHVQSNDITLLFEEQKDRKNIQIKLNEDKTFKDTEWEDFKKERIFKLSKGEGEKNIYVKYRDKDLEKTKHESEIQKIMIFIDKTPPKTIAYIYQKPVYISDNFQIKVHFNESMDTTSPVQINMISTGSKSPYVPEKGSFISIKKPNDTYLTPPISLTEEMGGAITIITTKAFDLAKNEMELEMKESFIFDTYAPVASKIIVKQGDYVTNPVINLKIPVFGASKMIISEKMNFSDAKWEKYLNEKQFTLSNDDGEKKIYFKFEDENKNISKVQIKEIILDRVKPQITKIEFPEKIKFNKTFNLKIKFSEEVQPYYPAIVIISSSGKNYAITNEGSFITDKIRNNIYITPDIVLDESMKGELIILIDKILDNAGNKMDETLEKLSIN